MDRQFIKLVEAIMKENGIQSDRSMSKLLDQHENFISRIKTGVQSVPANIWGILIERYNVKSLSLIDEDVVIPANLHRLTGNVIGNNSGTSTQTIGTELSRPKSEILLASAEEKLKAAEEKIKLLISQLADKERTIQILLKQQS